MKYTMLHSSPTVHGNTVTKKAVQKHITKGNQSKSVTCDAFISILTIENGVGIHCGTKDVVTQGSTYNNGENVVRLIGS